ncbi:hypothetical protein [Flavobacterium sp. XS2P14]|uniref:hypothetical protein n=1 Tax=Flavobacterium sp. XS2P14 TaxID=3401735 RepID=UPI003AAC2D22
MIKIIRNIFVFASLALFISCDKADLEQDTDVVNKDNILVEFDNIAITNNYNPAFKYYSGSNLINDKNEVNSYLKNSPGLDCDIDKKTIKFLTAKEVAVNNDLRLNRVAVAQPNPMVIYRGTSTHNGVTNWHYSYHNSGYIGHHVERWAHHPAAGYNGFIVYRDLEGANLNRFEIINYSKILRAKFGLWAGNGQWVYFYVAKHDTLGFNISPGSLGHSTSLVN